MMFIRIIASRFGLQDNGLFCLFYLFYGAIPVAGIFWRFGLEPGANNDTILEVWCDVAAIGGGLSAQ